MCVTKVTSSINCEDDDLSELIDNRKTKHPKLSDYDKAAQSKIKSSVYYNSHTASATHTMPIKVTQINFLNDKVMKQEFKKVCAVMAIPKFKGQHGHKTNSRRRVTTTWRVLFDSGSDGDLLFLKAGTARKSNILYTRRHSPQSWETSNGIFLTEKVARDLELTFPMFSHSKRIRIAPDIIEYNDEKNSPMFDLIMGTETMQSLGVKLDFSVSYS